MCAEHSLSDSKIILPVFNFYSTMFYYGFPKSRRPMGVGAGVGASSFSPDVGFDVSDCFCRLFSLLVSYDR